MSEWEQTGTKEIQNLLQLGREGDPLGIVQET